MMYKIRNFLVFLYTSLRVYYYKYRGLHIGKNVKIRRHTYFEKPSQIYIGDNCYINRNCEFYVGCKPTHSIIIGNNVWLGMNVCFISYSHKYDNPKQRAGNTIYGDIVVEDGAWIGGNSTILKGCVIGQGAIVASGAVVTKSVPANVLVGGYQPE